MLVTGGYNWTIIRVTERNEYMTTIYIVRHGKATAGWGSAHDPGLDEQGKNQAQKVARALASLGPLPIITSPLARARETSIPLAGIWNVSPRIEKRVGEIPSLDKNLTGRLELLRKIMQNTWLHLDENLKTWHRGVIDALCEIDIDTVVFSHFIAINAATGAATGDDRVVNFRPDNCSITIFKRHESGLELIERGAAANTHVG